MPRFPFCAIVGQDRLKQALLLNAVDPRVGGVLIRGERGTAKSTAVRALAAILPELTVVDGCSYRCDPHDELRLCEGCLTVLAESRGLPQRVVSPRIVDLPVSATEDRLVGTLDFEAALSEGTKTFQPGILAAANRAILYVDEVNLLDDHLVDTLLDVAVTGVNVVEREAVSMTHPASFILVGTMNPEEGELRPQLLDRFGLCVEVTAVAGAEQRVEIVRRRRAFDSDPAAFAQSFRQAEEALRTRVTDARAILDSVGVSDEVLYAVADLSVRARVDGHRADTVMVRAAAAHAALEGRDAVTLADVESVAEFVLTHRVRKTPFPHVGADAESLREALREALNPQVRTESDGVDSADVPMPGPGQAAMFEVAAPTEPVSTRADAQASLSAELDRVRRDSSGRRQRTVSSDGRGRYLRAERPTSKAEPDIALDATIRAAAARGAAGGKLADEPRIVSEDVRTKVRSRKTATSIVLCVDASGSMGTVQRVEAARAAVMQLLADAYVKRDRVSLVTFRGESGEVVLPPTSSVELARLRLGDVGTGGATPLAAGLETALEVALAEKRRDAGAVVWLVVVTDGKANVGRSGVSAVDEALKIARRVSVSGVKALVLDTETNPNSAASLALANAMRGDYVRLPSVRTGAIVDNLTERLPRV